jgi:hypothetical protein
MTAPVAKQKSRFFSAAPLPGYIGILCSIAAVLLMAGAVFEQGVMQQAIPMQPVNNLSPSHIINDSLYFLNFIMNIQVAAFFAAFGCVAFVEANYKITKFLRYSLLYFIIAGAAISAATFFIGAGDILNYVAYGYKLTVLGLSPYTPLSDGLPDPIIAATSQTWINVPSVYGPTAVLLFSFLNLLTAPHLGTLLLLFKAAWFLIFLLFAFLAHKLTSTARTLPYSRWFGLCANPVLWSLCLRDAHIELLMLTLTAACLLAVQRRAWIISGLLLGMLCATKAVALMWVPFILLYAFQNTDKQQRWRDSKKLLAGFVLYMAPLYSLSLGADWLLVIQSAASYQSGPQLIPWEINNIVGLPLLDLPEELVKDASRWLAEVVFLVGYAWILFRAYRRPITNIAMLLGVTMAWALLNMSYMHQWYLLWPLLPLALGVTSRKGVIAVIVVFTACGINFDSSSNTRILLLIIIPLAVFYWLKSVTSRL